jgi:FMN phosphatase YigB (HAD superfamily)
MIKALLLDLGNTLVDDHRVVFPGVPDALRAVGAVQTQAGKPLVMCLVSDYKMPQPRTPQAIDAAFKEYVAIIEAAQLREFFEPVDERVTLSTNAGVTKPDRRIFELALRRAKLDASLAETLFITEQADHIAACRAMGMTALQFGVDFQDWSRAPLLIAELVAPSSRSNLTAALKPLLAATNDMRLESIDAVSGGTVRGKGRGWVRLDAPELGALDGVHVELPVGVEATIKPGGGLADVRVKADPTDVAEAVQHVESLVSNRQVSLGPPGSSPVVPTHTVETDAKGRRLLRRRRFTAM